MPTILTFPNIAPAKAPFGIQTNTRVFTSPLSGTIQSAEMPGARWTARLVFRDLRGDAQREMQAFVLRMRGMAGRVYLYNHINQTPRGIATGTPLIKGASQTGRSLVTDGWTPSQTNILRAGDYFSFPTASGAELKMVTADADSDGSGNATLSIETPIRISPADNAVITTTQALGVFMFTEQGVEWGGEPGNFIDISLNFVEAIVP